MTPGWAVVWVGKTCTTFFTVHEDWSLDPEEAKFFCTRAEARLVAKLSPGVSVVRCWI